MTARKIERTVYGSGEAWYAVLRVDGKDVSACKLVHFSREAAERCAGSQKIPSSGKA